MVATDLFIPSLTSGCLAGLVKYSKNKISSLSVKDAINPLQLFVEKRQIFNQNNPQLNNIINH